MSTKKANKRYGRKRALRSAVSDVSPKRDSIRAARRQYGRGVSC